MNQGRTVFAQIMEFVSHTDFYRCVERYGGNRKVRRLSCWDQYLAMAFAQLTYRESLRDIEVCLRAAPAVVQICAALFDRFDPTPRPRTPWKLVLPRMR
jgi:hypothetical protein